MAYSANQLDIFEPNEVMTWHQFLNCTMEREEALHLLLPLSHKCLTVALLLKLGVVYTGETNEKTLEDLIEVWSKTKYFTYGTLLRVAQSSIINEEELGARIEDVLHRHYITKDPIVELLI